MGKTSTDLVALAIQQPAVTNIAMVDGTGKSLTCFEIKRAEKLYHDATARKVIVSGRGGLRGLDYTGDQVWKVPEITASSQLYANRGSEGAYFTHFEYSGPEGETPQTTFSLVDDFGTEKFRSHQENSTPYGKPLVSSGRVVVPFREMRASEPDSDISGFLVFNSSTGEQEPHPALLDTDFRGSLAGVVGDTLVYESADLAGRRLNRYDLATKQSVLTLQLTRDTVPAYREKTGKQHNLVVGPNNKRIYWLTQSGVTCLDLETREQTHYPLEKPFSLNRVDNTLIVSKMDRRNPTQVVGLDLDLREKWDRFFGEGCLVYAVGDGVICVPRDNLVKKLNKQGALDWEFTPSEKTSVRRITPEISLIH